MIFGIGTDIAKVSRFEKWAQNRDLICRFFNENERISENATLQRRAEHYASRFAAKEAFVKALGTGFSGIFLADFWIEKEDSGAPIIKMNERAQSFCIKTIGSDFKIHISISHEKEFAVAFALIEIKNSR